MKKQKKKRSASNINLRFEPEGRVTRRNGTRRRGEREKKIREFYQEKINEGNSEENSEEERDRERENWADARFP